MLNGKTLLHFVSSTYKNPGFTYSIKGFPCFKKYASANQFLQLHLHLYIKLIKHNCGQKRSNLEE